MSANVLTQEALAGVEAAALVPSSVAHDGWLDRACTLAPPEKLSQGLDAFFQGVEGRLRRLFGPAQELAAQAAHALDLCESWVRLSDFELEQRLGRAREDLRRDPLQACGRLVEALAVVGQQVARQLGMMPYRVQFMGALAIHRGLLAEMATGEGKTMTVGMAATLAGLTGRVCHVVTANDYLAQRDSHEMTRLFQACGLSVASIGGDLEPGERAQRYRADVVYLTAKELLADRLRDQIGTGTGERLAWQGFRRWLDADRAHGADERLLVRGLHTVIIDEADSILIDEAVTPLILSAPRPGFGLQEAVRQISALAAGLREGEHFQALIQSRAIVLTPAARASLAGISERLPEVWRVAARREELLRQALNVRRFFERGRHYVVQDGEIVLLDEFTGRMTPGRTLTAGLHQAIEAYEGLEITESNQSLTQMSFQTFFRRLRKLSGCTGTAWEAAGELWRVYGLQVVRIPTHRPRLTRYNGVRLLPDAQARWAAIASEVLHEQRQGRPVLVGVRSVAASEALAARLRDMGCEARVLNALEHEREAEIVAQAGQLGRVTIATHMAGRGTDIRLGADVRERGGLHVIVAEINESARVDRQLAGRCGRQGDPGSVSTYLSLDDELAQRLLPLTLRSLLGRLVRKGSRAAPRLALAAWRWAQRRTEREAFQRRLTVMRSDDWMTSALPFEANRSG